MGLRHKTGPEDDGRCNRVAHTRIAGFDTLRGFAVVSMVAFHLCYDLYYLRGLDIAWFEPPLRDIWRASISWTFLLLAGCMCSRSRSNLKRAGKYLGVALVVWLATTCAAVDTPISYGIIYCMGASTLVAWALGRAHALPRRPASSIAGAVMFATMFLCTLNVSTGKLGIGAAEIALPHELYGSGMLDWLGFPSPDFASGDYYPPLPYTLLFLSGTCLGRLMAATRTPKMLVSLRCRPLEWVGRHALPIYLLHQPLLVVALGLV